MRKVTAGGVDVAYSPSFDLAVGSELYVYVVLRTPLITWKRSFRGARVMPDPLKIRTSG